jgi:hypothetical protein
MQATSSRLVELGVSMNDRPFVRELVIWLLL